MSSSDLSAALVALAALGSISSGCAAPELPEPDPARFTGAASADESYVLGVVADEDGGVVYVCGATSETRANSEWLDLSPEGEITEKDGKRARGEATRTASGLTGKIVLRDGTELSFHIPEAATADHGLFAAVDAGCRTGVITYGGKKAASAGTWCSSDGRFEQVTPIAPIRDASLLVRIGTEDARSIRVTAVDLATIR